MAVLQFFNVWHLTNTVWQLRIISEWQKLHLQRQMVHTTVVVACVHFFTSTR